MSGICENRVVIITGAGRGFGREHALEFARQGAKVVVNDVGAETDGSGSSNAPANRVVAEIREMGGEAIPNGDDVSDWDGSRRIIDAALNAFGRLDALVNNAGIARDRMLINMTPGEWDDVIRVHLRGVFCMSRHAAAYWREQSKSGAARDTCIVNTTSGSGLYGAVGQTNYSAAKAGIAAFTLSAAQELGRYGVRVNAVSPGGRTRMNQAILEKAGQFPPAEGFDVMDPANVAPIVVWLASSEATGVSGWVFQMHGGRIAVAQGWDTGPTAERNQRWEVSELGPVLRDLVAEAGSPFRANPNAVAIPAS